MTLMVTETEVVEKTIEEEVTVYKCDKCRGRFHEATEDESDLNTVAFGAEVLSTATINVAPNNNHVNTAGMWDDAKIHAEYDYLLCDECMEKAHDYLSDFF